MRYDRMPYLCDLCQSPLGRDWQHKDYMVHDSVWVGEARLPKFGCIAHKECLEIKLGRTLGKADFIDAPVNGQNKPWEQKGR